ncbi:hypothetical protein ACFOMD_16300 [Sphingoaurantiacus capsulatus]|uniref:Flagellar protein FlgN n=1 Tax=Sphingoaurantiacus capsulatus TaxID=1771310 RepID=A0ABV7XHD7_9SPHN
MIPASLQRLEDCHHALIDALDAQDIDGLEEAIEAFRMALDDVRAKGAWHGQAGVLDSVARIHALSEAARIRVNFLTDLNQQRIDALAAARGRENVVVYGRTGRAA